MLGRLVLKIWKDPVWSKVIAAAIIGGAGLAVTGMALGWHIYPLTMSAVLVFVLLCVIAAIAVYAKTTGVFVASDGWFLGMSYSGTHIVVGTFQTRARNRSDEPIQQISGFVRSHLTNREYPLFLNVDGNMVAPEKTHGIPPRAWFEVSIPFYRADGSALEIETFIQEIGEFTFVMKCDDEVYKTKYSAKKVRDQIESFRATITGTASPRVTLRDF